MSKQPLEQEEEQQLLNVVLEVHTAERVLVEGAEHAVQCSSSYQELLALAVHSSGLRLGPGVDTQVGIVDVL